MVWLLIFSWRDWDGRDVVHVAPHHRQRTCSVWRVVQCAVAQCPSWSDPIHWWCPPVHLPGTADRAEASSPVLWVGATKSSCTFSFPLTIDKLADFWFTLFCKTDYRVGSAESSWSKVFHFKTLPLGNSWSPRLAIYGDLGFQNEESLPFLSKDVEKDLYDVIFHIGDFAYDLRENRFYSPFRAFLT